ncbi:acyl-CoA thioesterase [Alicyclobacillus acidiphilus]|uniref:acyl-CoA thioesterase n=1 Tax=Alicyclobacillus acidiphilus TaxID=182455 RepID=UPI00082ABB33|nr:thioesterase family protein [Alicyclobacillus acidiphilus]
MTVTQMKTTVRSTEIDVNGHVNNAKYLEYYEWGREDWYEHRGLTYAALRDRGVVTVVARAEVDYRHPAKQNDVLTITTWLNEVGRTSFRMKQHIVNATGNLISEGQFVIVCVHPDTGRPVPVPSEIAKYVVTR